MNRSRKFSRELDVVRYLIRKTHIKTVPHAITIGLVQYTNAEGTMFYSIISLDRFIDCSKATRVRYKEQQVRLTRKIRGTKGTYYA